MGSIRIGVRRRAIGTRAAWLAAIGLAATGVAARGDEPRPAPGEPEASVPEPAPEPAEERSELERVIAGFGDVEEVVVSRPHPFKAPIDWSGGRSVIGPEEIRTAGAPTIGDLLRRRPGFVMGEETESDSKPNFALRGLSPQRGNEVAMLVDGVPLSPAPYAHPGQSLFPITMERIHAIDIIRGGYSVRYGPNNVAGVINFLTRPIPESPELGERFRVGSNGLFSAYTWFGGTFGDLGILIEDVHKGGDTWRENGRYRIENQGVKLSWSLSDELRVLIQYDRFADDSDLSGGMDDAYYKTGDLSRSLTPEDWFDGDQDRGNVRVIWEPERDVRYEAHLFGMAGLRTFVLGSPSYYGRLPSREPTTLRSNERRMSVWGLQLTHTVPVDHLPVANRLTIGGRYQRELFINRPFSWRFPDGPETVLANQRYIYDITTFFLEHELFLTDRLTFTPAVRFESVDIRARNRVTPFSVNRSFSEQLPGMSLSYLLDDRWAAFTSWQSTYRPPVGSQIEISKKAQDISAERARTWEVGTRGEFADGLFSGELTYFSMDFRDRIQSDPENQDVNLNIGEQESDGIELYLTADLGKVEEALEGVSIYVSGTWIDGQYKTAPRKGNDLAGAPPRQFGWGIAYRHRSGLRGGIDGLKVARHFADADNSVIPSASGSSGVNPEYSLWGARVGYDFEVSQGGPRCSIDLGVTNLFGEDYFDRNGNKGIVPAPERALFCQVALTIDL